MSIEFSAVKEQERLYNSTQKNNRFTKCIGTEIK